MSDHQGDTPPFGQPQGRPNWPERRPGVHLTASTGSERPTAIDGPFVVERLTGLAHDLNNLLDGSIRCLTIAKRAATLLPAASVEAETVRRNLDVASLAMERMGDLVNAAMRGSSSPVGSAELTPAKPITLDEAIRHAVDVLAPEAQQRHVRVLTRVDLQAGRIPVGPLYSVVLNGLKNAIEAIPADRKGSVEIDAMTVSDAAAETDGITFVMIIIRDDGVGLADNAAGERAFHFGYTTKPRIHPGCLARGVGLSLSRELVRQRGGSIELVPRHLGPDSAGAELRILYPHLDARHQP